ncbi:unnamed protein product [Closterium sp. Yama58-4]|nr:unnamed protein product [Closterium sp. Yama58-4]
MDDPVAHSDTHPDHRNRTGGSLSAPVLVLALIGALAVFTEVVSLVRVGVSPSYVSFSSAVAAVHGRDATWTERGTVPGDPENDAEGEAWPADAPNIEATTEAAEAAGGGEAGGGEGSSGVDALPPLSLLSPDSRAGLMFDALLRAQFRVQQAWAAGELLGPTVRWFRKGVVEGMAAEALWRPADVIAAAAADAAVGAADPDAAAKAASEAAAAAAAAAKEGIKGLDPLKRVFLRLLALTAEWQVRANQGHAETGKHAPFGLHIVTLGGSITRGFSSRSTQVRHPWPDLLIPFSATAFPHLRNFVTNSAVRACGAICPALSLPSFLGDSPGIVITEFNINVGEAWDSTLLLRQLAAWPSHPALLNLNLFGCASTFSHHSGPARGSASCDPIPTPSSSDYAAAAAAAAGVPTLSMARALTPFWRPASVPRCGNIEGSFGNGSAAGAVAAGGGIRGGVRSAWVQLVAGACERECTLPKDRCPPSGDKPFSLPCTACVHKCYAREGWGAVGIGGDGGEEVGEGVAEEQLASLETVLGADRVHMVEFGHELAAAVVVRHLVSSLLALTPQDIQLYLEEEQQREQQREQSQTNQQQQEQAWTHMKPERGQCFTTNWGDYRKRHRCPKLLAISGQVSLKSRQPGWVLYPLSRDKEAFMSHVPNATVTFAINVNLRAGGRLAFLFLKAQDLGPGLVRVAWEGGGGKGGEGGEEGGAIGPILLNAEVWRSPTRVVGGHVLPGIVPRGKVEVSVTVVPGGGNGAPEGFGVIGVFVLSGLLPESMHGNRSSSPPPLRRFSCCELQHAAGYFNTSLQLGKERALLSPLSRSLLPLSPLSSPLFSLPPAAGLGKSLTLSLSSPSLSPLFSLPPAAGLGMSLTLSLSSPSSLSYSLFYSPSHLQLCKGLPPALLPYGASPTASYSRQRGISTRPCRWARAGHYFPAHSSLPPFTPYPCNPLSLQRGKCLPLALLLCAASPIASHSRQRAHGQPSSGPPPLRRFSYRELQQAAGYFNASLQLGKGSFGTVFRGQVDEWLGELPRGSKREVAVKVLHTDSVKAFDDCLAEILVLGDLSHPNLVRLLGYCMEDSRAILVYELVERGDLHHWLHPNDLSPDSPCLTWEQRVQVAVGMAEGLAYLHGQNIIHRDFKSHNVMLNRELRAKVTDFGMATRGPEEGKTHVSTRIMGTLGYLDPDYIDTGHLTPLSDVFSLGVVLLELLTGRSPATTATHNRLFPWIHKQLARGKKGGGGGGDSAAAAAAAAGAAGAGDEEQQQQGEGKKADGFHISQVVDPRLKGQFSASAAKKLLLVALQCSQEEPSKRPDMNRVAERLREIAASGVGKGGAQRVEGGGAGVQGMAGGGAVVAGIGV